MSYQLVRRLVPNRISKNYNSFKSKISLDVPERLKGTVFEKLANFWKNLLRDYAEVVKETSKDIKERPKKALVYAWGLWTWLYCVKTNPDDRVFRDQLLSASTEIASLPNSIRNKESSSHLVFLESCYNAGTLRRLNLGVCSFMWMSDYGRTVGLYAAQCEYLEPKYLSFHERIIDVGLLGQWWMIRRKMKDFDVNPDEWNGEAKRQYI